DETDDSVLQARVLSQQMRRVARQAALDPGDGLGALRCQMRHRMNVYFPPELLKQIADLADRKKLSRSGIVEAAVASFLSPDGADRREAAFCAAPRSTVAAGPAARTESRNRDRDLGTVRPLLADDHPAPARGCQRDGAVEKPAPGPRPRRSPPATAPERAQP